jgi:hypothetical protein
VKLGVPAFSCRDIAMTGAGVHGPPRARGPGGRGLRRTAFPALRWPSIQHRRTPARRSRASRRPGDGASIRDSTRSTTRGSRLARMEAFGAGAEGLSGCITTVSLLCATCISSDSAVTALMTGFGAGWPTSAILIMTACTQVDLRHAQSRRQYAIGFHCVGESSDDRSHCPAR